jgi:hypothetical protein
MEKVVRTICVFADKATNTEVALINRVAKLLEAHQFSIQTKRICLSSYQQRLDDKLISDNNLMMGFGSFSREAFRLILPYFVQSAGRRLTLDLSQGPITREDIDTLFQLLSKRAENTFGFAFGFNLPPSSPFYPSAMCGKQGFSIGLQATDLSEGCSTLDEWFVAMKNTWNEIDQLLQPIEGYLGIDSSIAPLYSGKSSLVHFVRRLGLDFSHSATTDLYTQISSYIKTNNPRPIGLCGLMFPCCEDFELAEEYEKGNFSIERNLFLSLHSGLGIDTYPIGVDQDPERVVEIARLTQQLSNKYQKPLTIRLVSDGRAKIGDRSNFSNPLLKDVVIRPL